MANGGVGVDSEKMERMSVEAMHAFYHEFLGILYRKLRWRIW